MAATNTAGMKSIVARPGALAHLFFQGFRGSMIAQVPDPDCGNLTCGHGGCHGPVAAGGETLPALGMGTWMMGEDPRQQAQKRPRPSAWGWTWA